MNVWVKPGPLTRVECLSVSYRLSPTGYHAQTLGKHIDEQTGPLLQANGIPFCGVVNERNAAGEGGKASHLMKLTSKTGEINYTIQMVTFNVDVELVELASNEVVFRGRTIGWVQPTVGVSRMLSRPLNSMNDLGLVSIPGGRLKYAVPDLAGRVVWD